MHERTVLLHLRRETSHPPWAPCLGPPGSGEGWSVVTWPPALSLTGSRSGGWGCWEFGAAPTQVHPVVLPCAWKPLGPLESLLPRGWLPVPAWSQAGGRGFGPPKEPGKLIPTSCPRAPGGLQMAAGRNEGCVRKNLNEKTLDPSLSHARESLLAQSLWLQRGAVLAEGVPVGRCPGVLHCEADLRDVLRLEGLCLRPGLRRASQPWASPAGMQEVEADHSSPQL